MKCDWHLLENSGLIFDAPRMLNGSKAPSSDLQDQLVLTLKSLELKENDRMLKEILNGNFDMSQAPFKLVLSAPGKMLQGWKDVEKFGLGRLGKILREYGIKPKKGGVLLEAQVSEGPFLLAQKLYL